MQDKTISKQESDTSATPKLTEKAKQPTETRAKVSNALDLFSKLIETFSNKLRMISTNPNYENLEQIQIQAFSIAQ